MKLHWPDQFLPLLVAFFVGILLALLMALPIYIALQARASPLSTEEG